MLLDPSRLAMIRTAVAVAGVGYAAVALGSACLDHYEESFGGCPAASEAPRAGSGEGSGAVAPANADCGAPAAEVDAGIGSGSGSGSAAAP